VSKIWRKNLCKKEQEAETLVKMLVYSQNNEGSGNIFFSEASESKKMSKATKKIQIKAKSKSQFTKQWLEEI